jgi:methylmalonyl-CoA epimerase
LFRYPVPPFGLALWYVVFFAADRNTGRLVQSLSEQKALTDQEVRLASGQKRGSEKPGSSATVPSASRCGGEEQRTTTEDGMKIKRIEHIAIAVENLDGMAGLLRDKFGIEVEYNEDIARSRTRLAMLPVGESYIELLQGMAPGSRAAEWVAQKGQSLFHICFEVEDIDAALAELKAKNTPLLNETPIIGHGNCRIAFVDPKATGDILFELAEMPRDDVGAAAH